MSKRLRPSPRPEFPTIADLRDGLTELIEQGLGDHPVQLVIAPESTLRAVAMAYGMAPDGKPGLMVDLVSGKSGRLPAALTSIRALQSLPPESRR